VVPSGLLLLSRADDTMSVSALLMLTKNANAELKERHPHAAVRAAFRRQECAVVLDHIMDRCRMSPVTRVLLTVIIRPSPAANPRQLNMRVHQNGVSGMAQIVDHVVVLTQENHTTDNYFSSMRVGGERGDRPGGAGQPARA
jgi:phospholipase C